MHTCTDIPVAERIATASKSLVAPDVSTIKTQLEDLILLFRAVQSLYASTPDMQLPQWVAANKMIGDPEKPVVVINVAPAAPIPPMPVKQEPVRDTATMKPAKIPLTVEAENELADQINPFKAKLADADAGGF